MDTSVREELHRVIDEASEERLAEIYGWVNRGMVDGSRYTQDEIEEFYELWEEHKRSPGKLYSAEEALVMIKKGQNI